MRVLAVVGRSIMVYIYDVVPGDILHIRGDESDPIIERVEHSGDEIRFQYKVPKNVGTKITKSSWMLRNSRFGNKTFIHDLKNERLEFDANADR